MDLQNKWAIGGVFVAAAGALVGLAIWLSPGPAAPAGPEIAPAGADVTVTATSPTTPADTAVTTSSQVAPPQPANNGQAGQPEVTTNARVQQQPSVAAELTSEPAAPTTAATTLPPGQSSATPPAPVCRWVYDGPGDHVGHEVCEP